MSLRREKADLISELEAMKLQSEEDELRALRLKELRIKAIGSTSEALGGLPASLLASTLLIPYPSSHPHPHAPHPHASHHDTGWIDEPEVDPNAPDAEAVSLRSLDRLRQVSQRYLQQLVEETHQRLHHEVIHPLQERAEGLSQELEEVKGDLIDLQEQVRETLVAGDAALVAVREEAESAAEEVTSS